MHIILLLLILLLSACALMAAFQERGRNGNPHGKSVKISCSKCHESGSFVPIRSSPDFDHGSTGFPLKGMHAGIYCRDCHQNLVFSDVETQCVDCHADIHRRQVGADCKECHSIRGWNDIRRHPDGHLNRFPLLGAHSALQCEDCHTGGVVGQFRGLRTDCDSCHHQDYVEAKVVDHQAAAFPLSCETCHSMDGWLAQFDHGSATGFALGGAHSQLQCQDCHTNLVFTATPADCIGCHLQDYNQTTDPNHAQASFSQDCATCHSTASWQGAFFNHSGTQFPLTGAHTELQCQDCHSSGLYSGLPSDCYACHSSDFQGTTDPAHAAAGFSHDCTECHTTSAWTGATFTHSDFPIYSGAHARVWNTCSDCHTNSSSYAIFTCTSCHGVEDTNSHHHDVSGYVYDSNSCYACHPNGRAD
jgi:Zn finger protein HypA/HybF involved in hydrogenase expression